MTVASPMSNAVHTKTVCIQDAYNPSSNLVVEVTKVSHWSVFGFSVDTYSARTRETPLYGCNVIDAVEAAYDVSVSLNGKDDREFFQLFYANCPTCGARTDIELHELSRNNPNEPAPVICTFPRHHIGELMSDGSYE